MFCFTGPNYYRLTRVWCLAKAFSSVMFCCLAFLYRRVSLRNRHLNPDQDPALSQPTVLSLMPVNVALPPYPSVVCLVSLSKCQLAPTLQSRPSHPRQYGHVAQTASAPSAARQRQICASPHQSHPRCIRTSPEASHRNLISSKQRMKHRGKWSKGMKVHQTRIRQKNGLQVCPEKEAYSNNRRH